MEDVRAVREARQEAELDRRILALIDTYPGLTIDSIRGQLQKQGLAVTRRPVERTISRLKRANRLIRWKGRYILMEES